MMKTLYTLLLGAALLASGCAKTDDKPAAPVPHTYRILYNDDNDNFCGIHAWVFAISTWHGGNPNSITRYAGNGLYKADVSVSLSVGDSLVVGTTCGCSRPPHLEVTRDGAVMYNGFPSGMPTYLYFAY